MKLCCVYVCNKRYFKKFIYSCVQLIKNGKYKGDICLIISDDLLNNELLKLPFFKKNNIIIKHFEKIKIPKEKYKNATYSNKVDGCSLKFNLFRVFFKKWNYILYIDCGMNIFYDISPIINEATENKLLAHSDAYPTYKWKLRGQFKNDIKLNKKYNLDIDYFQSGFMLFDTNIIKNNTFNEIIELIHNYPTGRTNDQCYLSIYFIIINPCWKQLRIKNNNYYFYDIKSRNKNNKYIMLKIK